jgi:hypothetical protein
MAAELGGAARLDGVHGATLGAGERVGLPIRHPVGAEDLGELHARPSAPARRGQGRQGHGLVDARRLGQIERRVGAGDALLAEVEVAHRGRDVLVAELVLHGGEIGGVRFEGIRGEGVAQGMGCRPACGCRRVASPGCKSSGPR